MDIAEAALQRTVAQRIGANMQVRTAHDLRRLLRDIHSRLSNTGGFAGIHAAAGQNHRFRLRGGHRI